MVDSDSIGGRIARLDLDAQIEVAVLKNSTENFKIENKRFRGSELDESEGAIVRCIYKGRGSIVSGNVDRESDIDGLINYAYKLAKITGSDDFQRRFYGGRPAAATRTRIGGGKSTDFVERLIGGVNRVKNSKTLYSLNSVASKVSVVMSGANSFGIGGDMKAEISMLATEVISKDGSNQGTGSEYSESRNLDDIDVSDNLSSAFGIAKSMLGAKAAPTCNGQLLLDSRAAISFLGSFVSALDGEDVYKKKSFLGNMKNKGVAAKGVCLSEKAEVAGSLYNRSFDDEFVPTTSKDIVRYGVLKGFLHSMYSAEKMRSRPTGNDFSLTRGGISTVNLALRPGRYRFGDMLAKIKRGIYMIETGDEPNEATGDLSAMVSVGYYVENGKILYPVKETMIGANVLDMMRNVTDIGSDKRSMYGITSPSLLIENVKISGRA